METYCAESVQRYRSLAVEDPNRIPTLLTKFFETSLSDAEVTDEAMNFIIAGSDTTATTLTYLVWAVCSDPSIKKTLVSELASLPDDFKDQDLRGLPYLNQVIEETLRLYAATPSGLPRVSSENSILANHCIPAGTTVTTQAYSLHRDADIFPDPERCAHVHSIFAVQESDSIYTGSIRLVGPQGPKPWRKRSCPLVGDLVFVSVFIWLVQSFVWQRPISSGAFQGPRFPGRKACQQQTWNK